MNETELVLILMQSFLRNFLKRVVMLGNFLILRGRAIYRKTEKKLQLGEAFASNFLLSYFHPQ